MKTLKFDDKESWLEARRGKITGTRLAEVVNTAGITKDMIVKELESLKIEVPKGAKKEELDALLPMESRLKLEQLLPKKLGFYKLIAERISIKRAEGETPMDRGVRLEEEAIGLLGKELGKNFDTSLVIWTRDDEPSIAVSPDGFVQEKKKITIAGEIKCLASERHIQALIENQIPDEYSEQKIQYFAVNKDLKTLYFGFYDPNLIVKQFFYIKVDRKEIEEEIDAYVERQKQIIKEVNKIVNELTF